MSTAMRSTRRPRRGVVAGRYEYVDDSKGGFMTIGTKAQSFTVTSDHLIAGGLKARLEIASTTPTATSS